MGKRNKRRRAHSDKATTTTLHYDFSPKDIEIIYTALDEAPLQKLKQWGFSGEEIIAVRNRVKAISEDVLFEQHPGALDYDLD